MKNPYPGLFVVVEGIDGAGKSTLAKKLYMALKKKGLESILTFEPTKGKWGKKLRRSFFSSERLTPQEELALFSKDRREHLDKVIVPALKDGRIVVCDRYFYSTAAYQGARGLDPKKIMEQSRKELLEPDLCFLLSIEPEIGLKRIRDSRSDGPNNFEKLDYLKKVQGIYDQLDGSELVRLDATQPVDELVKKAVERISSEKSQRA